MHGRALLFLALGIVHLAGCSSSCTGSTDTPPAVVTPPPEPLGTAGLPAPPPGVLPTLLVAQAQFVAKDGRQVPGPARLTLLKTDGKAWYAEVVEDPKSNVFHKAIPWRGGILTIGAEDARLVHWTKKADKWEPQVLWEKSWGGKFDRLRDLELGDVDGDGKEDIVLASHDKGVVAVGIEQADKTWKFHELDETPDMFVHEIEIGDVDGDGKTEFYATPSARNRASGESQPGGVARYTWVPGGEQACPTCGAFSRAMIAQWGESHAKELLVADTDGDKRPELYAVREAHTAKNATTGSLDILDPVRIVRLTPAEDGKPWTETTVATLQDRQSRFLVPVDLDGDGKKELMASGYKTGIYMLKAQADGTFTPTLVDAGSTGFENVVHVADLDKDGKPEVYAVGDDQKAVFRYRPNPQSPSGFDRDTIMKFPDGTFITWNLQDAEL